MLGQAVSGDLQYLFLETELISRVFAAQRELAAACSIAARSSLQLRLGGCKLSSNGCHAHCRASVVPLRLALSR